MMTASSYLSNSVIGVELQTRQRSLAIIVMTLWLQLHVDSTPIRVIYYDSY